MAGERATVRKMLHDASAAIRNIANPGGMVVRKQFLVLVSASMLCGCIAQALTSGHIAFSDDGAGAVPRISAHERMVIHDYCANRVRAAQDSRIASGLRANHRLPPRLAYHNLPTRLESRLEPLPQPYARVIVGTDVLVINRHTRMIVDLARGACEPRQY